MSGRPKRVLHIVRAMNRGGVETWLMNLLRHLDRQLVQMDFLVHTSESAAYDAEILGRQSRLLRCTDEPWKPTYAFRVTHLLSECGPYDVIHSHVHHFSGYLMALARRLGVPSRIAHSHTDTSRSDAEASWFRRGYLALSRRLIRADATVLMAASQPAAKSLFGENWKEDPRALVLHCGLDLSPFRRTSERSSVRAFWGIKENDFVIGHVGRFVESKNHQFLLDVFEEIVRRQPGSYLLLLGDGRLRNKVQERARRARISERVIFAGARDDIPRLLNAMDAFVFPSVWEGLGLTLIEAQAAGLPCVISDSIPREADVVAGLIRRLPLSRPASDWATAALERQVGGHRAADALVTVEQSSFNISNSMDRLYALYGA